MNTVYEKAQTLIEALPYIQKFANKKVVVKYGGSAMLNAELEADVIRDVALLKLVGMQPIIVHGGGKEISRWVKLLGKEPEFVNGLRVTDKETMDVAEMVLLKVNKHLVGMLEKTGVKACGICGKDGGTLKAQKKLIDGKDIGFVGDVTKVDTTLIDTLIQADVIPVIAPIALDCEGQPYNINADDAAYAIATAVGAEKLAFLTDVEGIYGNPSDPSTLISMMTTSEAEQLIAKGSVGQGMLPKLNNCIDAVKNGVSRVHILDGRVKHCLLLEFYTNSGVGTAIHREEEDT